MSHYCLLGWSTDHTVQCAGGDAHGDDQTGRGGLPHLDVLLPPPGAEPQLLQPAGPLASLTILLATPSNLPCRLLHICSTTALFELVAVLVELRNKLASKPPAIEPWHIADPETLNSAGHQPPAPVGPPVGPHREHAVRPGAVARDRHRGTALEFCQSVCTALMAQPVCVSMHHLAAAAGITAVFLVAAHARPFMAQKHCDLERQP